MVTSSSPRVGRARGAIGAYPLREETAILISAPLSRVWSALIEVWRWPDWTASVRSARPAEPSPLQAGSLVRVKQPGIPTATWRVIRFESYRRFDWETRIPGLRMSATHHLVAVDRSRVSVDLAIALGGPLTDVFGPRIRRMACRNLDLEASGLKAVSER